MCFIFSSIQHQPSSNVSFAKPSFAALLIIHSNKS